MIKTELCELLGVKYPIMQAAMGPYDTSDLAAAVSNAGGFGIVSHPAPQLKYGIMALVKDTDKLKESFEDVKQRMMAAIRKVSRLTDKPFGVNFRVAPEQPDVPYLLDSLLEERERDPELARKLRLVITSAGDPTQPHLKKIKDAGMIWFHTVPSVYHAKKAEKAGVDGVIATGHEAGGHVAYHPISTLVLVPEVVKSVKVPVVAGGGICDGKGLVSALAWGAKGIYMGTRFIATRECEFNHKVKEAIVASSERFPKVSATIVTQGVFGPLRHLRNKYSEKLLELTRKLEAGEIDLLDVYQYESDGTFKAKGPEGDVENGAIWCGQVAVRLHEIPTVREVIEGIVSEAESILQDMCRRFLQS